MIVLLILKEKLFRDVIFEKLLFLVINELVFNASVKQLTVLHQRKQFVLCKPSKQNFKYCSPVTYSEN